MPDEMVPFGAEAPSVTDIDAKLERIAELKTKMDAAKKLKDEFDALKDEVAFAMLQAGTARTMPHAGIYATMVEKNGYAVSDPLAVLEYLEDNVADPMAYYKLDVTTIKKMADEKLRDFGELIPGLDRVTTRSLTINSEKKK